jgi:dUTP pyrophosphatase
MAALLLSRSGLGTKHGIVIKQGVGLIDSDYTDELIAVMHNIGDARYVIKDGERICQLLFTPVLDYIIGSSDSTARDGGFGSTGA